MKLSDLLLNRYLYKDSNQDSETKDASFQSVNSNPEEPVPIPSGGAAQDINTSNVTIDGDVITPGTFPPGLLDIANWGWTQTSVFTSASATQVDWGAGTFTSSDGTSYAIGGGNTGAMAGKTYIYLDILTSETAYQITTTPTDAVGLGKVLVAVAQNGATSATFNLNEATQIVGDNILANTIDATKMNVAQLSAITADIGSITSGTITGALIRTSASGLRIEMDDDALESYDTGGVRRTRLQNAGLAFYDSSGDLSGNIFGGNTDELAIETGGQLYHFDEVGFYPVGIIGAVGSLGLPAATSHWNTGYIDDLFTDELDIDDGVTLGGVRITAWTDIASGANTALSNLSSVAINTSLISDTGSTDNLGSSGIPWNNLYIDDIYLTNGAGTIKYNGNTALDFFASSVRPGSGYNDFSPSSSLAQELGTSSLRWGNIYVDEVQASGDVYCDALRLLAGTAHNPTTEGEITFYDSGTIQYRGQIVSTDYSFDLTVA